MPVRASSTGVRVVPLTGLSPRQQAEDALVCHSAFGSIFARPGEYRRSRSVSERPSFAPYRGLAAIEADSVVARLEVVRFSLRVPGGRWRAGGLGGVATRPDRTRRGLAARLITAAHTRESDEGARVCLLFTGRNLVAHDLYESLGYCDLRSFPRAIRSVPASAPRPGRPWRWRRARPRDRRAIETVHRTATARLYGLTPRPKGWWKSDSAWWVLARGDAQVGYARVDSAGDGGYACLEAFARDSEAFDALWAGIEWTARGRFLALGTNLLGSVDAARLADRGYVPTDASFGVLMARLLPRTRSATVTRSILGADGPRYSVFRADGF